MGKRRRYTKSQYREKYDFSTFVQWNSNSRSLSILPTFWLFLFSNMIIFAYILNLAWFYIRFIAEFSIRNLFVSENIKHDLVMCVHCTGTSQFGIGTGENVTVTLDYIVYQQQSCKRAILWCSVTTHQHQGIKFYIGCWRKKNANINQMNKNGNIFTCGVNVMCTLVFCRCDAQIQYRR